MSDCLYFFTHQIESFSNKSVLKIAGTKLQNMERVLVIPFLATTTIAFYDFAIALLYIFA